VELGRLQQRERESQKTPVRKPLVERLGEYPAEGVDLDNIVVYPPKLEPIPIKPLFLDVAWNYIAYPSRDGTKKKQGVAATAADAKAGAEEKQLQKRGWFGFGR
jgi:signal recognition particle subunit SRP68